MKERKERVFVALFMHWCLCALIQQVFSLKALFIGYKLEKQALFIAQCSETIV